MCLLIVVPQLSINGTNVSSVTNRSNEPQFHVKENAGVIVLCIRLESLEKDSLLIDYFTVNGTACEYFNVYTIFTMIHM